MIDFLTDWLGKTLILSMSILPAVNVCAKCLLIWHESQNHLIAIASKTGSFDVVVQKKSNSDTIKH